MLNYVLVYSLKSHPTRTAESEPMTEEEANADAKVLRKHGFRAFAAKIDPETYENKNAGYSF
jgi:hypothetical protein